MRETLQPHDIKVMHKDGKYVLCFVDDKAGLIRWQTAGDMTAYKLGLDMRDHRSAYVQAKRRVNGGMRDKAQPVTDFFNSHHNLLEAA